MQHRFIRVASVVVACLLAASAFAADSGVEPKSRPGAAAKPASKKAAAKEKLVDINSASKAELKKLPFIGDEEAERIIAGRPFLSKAHLVTKGYISPGAYEAIKNKVVARQDATPKK
jgi:competence protein ComEA